MKNKYNFIDYILLTLLIAVSAWPITTEINDEMLFFLFFLLIYIFHKRKLHLDNQFILFFFIFLIITGIQLATFQFFPRTEIFGMFLKLIIGYLCVKTLKESFVEIFINIMIFLTLISFLFWVPCAINSNFVNFLEAFAPFHPEGFENGNYIIYHNNFGLIPGSLARNAGPFWEPGVLGGFLIIALIFNFVKNPYLLNKKNLIIFAGIISTFSTTAYIALFIFIISYYLIYSKKLKYILMITPLILLAFYAFNNLPFLGDKLNLQQNAIYNPKSYSEHRSRFTSAIVDFNDFQKYPLTGRGKFEKTRFDNVLVATNRNNGTTDFIVMYGLVGFIVYFFSYFKSFYNYLLYYKLNKNFSYLFLLIILIIGFSENYFLLPFFGDYALLGILN